MPAHEKKRTPETGRTPETAAAGCTPETVGKKSMKEKKRTPETAAAGRTPEAVGIKSVNVKKRTPETAGRKLSMNEKKRTPETGRTPATAAAGRTPETAARTHGTTPAKDGPIIVNEQKTKIYKGYVYVSDNDYELEADDHDQVLPAKRQRKCRLTLDL